VILRVAWRILTHEKGRTALATAGIFIAILLVFVELGFFVAVPQGGMLIYSNMRFDLLLCSTAYVYQAQSGQFPAARMYQTMASPAVERVAPVYFGAGRWLNRAGGRPSDIFVIGLRPNDAVFAVPSIERQAGVLDRPDTVLADSATRPSFGRLAIGQRVDIAGRPMTIGGVYDLGTGFLGLGVALLSEPNFFRVFPARSTNSVNLGLVTLKRGVDPDRAAAGLRASLPDDVIVLTRTALESREVAYWTTRTSTGLIFGSGLLVAFIVGIMVLYQTLSTQIARQLPEFATLKAIGYTDAALSGIVVALALLIVITAFVPALAAALAIYSVVRNETMLPVALSTERLAAVLAITLFMTAVSAFLSLGVLRRADPADVF
jgi:putative ABC transport system permease protein